MDKVSAFGNHYTLDNLMNGCGLSVEEIVNVHRIPTMLANAQVYVFRINDARHIGEYHAPLFTTNIFVKSLLPALVDARAVATFSFPSQAHVPFYKWHLFEKLLEHDIVEEVARRGGNAGETGRFELNLNRGVGLAKLDLVGFSTSVRMQMASDARTYDALVHRLEGPHWRRLDGTVELDMLSGRPRTRASLDSASRALVA